MRDTIAQNVKSGWAQQVRLTQDLVRIPSLTGHEKSVQERVALAMSDCGLSVDSWCPQYDELSSHPAFCNDDLPLDDRPVVVGKWKGSGGGRSLILNGHTDVVPAGDETLWRYNPWKAMISDGILYGRGACDMKAGMGAALAAITALRRSDFKPRGDILIQSVIGEETGGVGTLATIVRGYHADAAIIMEPTDLAISPVGSGALSFRLTVHGKAAHGGLREEGVSAVEVSLPLFKVLQDFEARRHAEFQHPLFTKKQLAAPLSIGIIRTGDWVSTVPEKLMAEGRYGVFPGETLADARQKFEEVIARAAKRNRWLTDHPPIVEWFEGQFEPGETPGDTPVVQTLAASHQTVTGTRPQITGVPYGSDLRLFTNYTSTPCVLYGAGDVRVAHTVQESVRLDDVRTLTHVLALTIADWCG